jgi:hypothetical protein
MLTGSALAPEGDHGVGGASFGRAEAQVGVYENINSGLDPVDSANEMSLSSREKSHLLFAGSTRNHTELKSRTVRMTETGHIDVPLCRLTPK